jgi:hypothetical protein
VASRGPLGNSRTGSSLRNAGCVASQEHQSKLADLQLVAVLQHSRGYGFAVYIGAVEAADVGNLESPLTNAAELGVSAADGDVVEEDFALRVTTGRRGGLVEQEPRPGAWAALHHQ